MVLDALSSSLKGTLQKIAKVIFVDEKLLNELVKDIQRALLQADVNVKLVFELTSRIKERAQKEEPAKGLTKREQLINIVYEELVKFLGGEKADVSIEGKQRIMLVGLFGSGKCVHKDTNVLLGNGQTIKIEKLYNIYRKQGEVALEDGYIVPVKNELLVPSFNSKTLKIEQKRVSHLWKLKKEELVKVSLDNGNNFSIKTTPEHPFFILQNGRVIQVHADKLKKGDMLAVPNEVHTEPCSFDFFEKMRMMNMDVKCGSYLPVVKQAILQRYKSLKNALKVLPHKRNYVNFTHSLKKGQVPLFFFNLSLDELELKSYTAQSWITFPGSLRSELAEFIGYVVGDGYLSRNSVNISTADDEIIERISYLSRQLFGLSTSITPDKRSKAVNLRVNSQTLVKLINELFGIPIGKKTSVLEVPQIIQEASVVHSAQFIRAYFDCDAHMAPSTRSIEVVSESELLIKQIQHMFLRFNILGTQSRKMINNKYYYRLFLTGRNTEKYAEKIGSLLPRKKKALSGYAIIARTQGDGKTDMIPVGTLLQELRLAKGHTIGQIQQHVSSYGLYELHQRISRSQLKKVVEFYDLNTKGNIALFLELLNNKEVSNLEKTTELNKGLLNALVGEFKKKKFISEVTNSPTKLVMTEKGKVFFEEKNNTEEKYSTIKSLAFSNVSWSEVKDSYLVKNDDEYVYDMTVENNHSFIADGIVVHNTTTAGKLAKYFVKRGKKVALVGLDVHRPAAMEQLRQVGAQVHVPVFIDMGKDPVELYEKLRKDLEVFDVVIVDTAGRDALSDDLVKELADVAKAVVPTESLLVISADIGQAAQRQAEMFHKTCKISGVVVTKMDGTAKGGGALSACAVTGAPIRFIGVGEKFDDFEVFNPKGFVGRLLGMGDLEALLEKAKEAVSVEEAQDLEKKLLKGEFTLMDLYQQMDALKKMGSLGKLMEMIPGMGQLHLPKDALDVQEGKLEKWRFAMNSMTKGELEDPEIIDGVRVDRISAGSGVESKDIRDLIKQYRQGKKLVKLMKGADSPEKLMKKFKGKMPKLF